MELSAIADFILKWVIAPVVGFVWLLYRNQQKHGTEIAVMQATMSLQKESHDREFKEMRENFKRVFEKLDGIEQALRK